jgi:hypothetical protein
MHKFTAILIGLAAITATTATAQTMAPAGVVASQLKVGAKVYDPAGVELAVIESVTPTNIIISTGTSKVSLAPSSLGVGAKGPVLIATRAQLDAAGAGAADAAEAALMAKLIAGTEVRSLNATTVVGSVQSVEGEFVLVTTPDGDVRVPVSGFRLAPAGLLVGLSATDFAAAVAAAKPQG